MGSLAMLAMVDQVIPSRHGGEQRLHPFFQANRPVATEATKEPSTTDTQEPPPADELTDSSHRAADGGSQGEETPAERRGGQQKRLKPGSQGQDGEKRQRPKKRTKVSKGGNIADHFARLSNGGTSSPDPTDGSGPSVSEGNGGGHEGGKQSEPETTYAIESAPSLARGPAQISDADRPRPTKVIRLNLKTGTLGSPPKAKAPPTEPESEAVNVGNGGSNSHGKRAKPSRTLQIRYGIDAESRIRIGDKITAILSSPRALSTGSANTFKLAETKSTADLGTLPPPPPPKVTHPFFMGGFKPSRAASRPGDANAECSKSSPVGDVRGGDHSSKPVRTISNGARGPRFGFGGTGLKVPGSKSPAWPWKDMVHIRGDHPGFSALPEMQCLALSSRKSKGRAVGISARESMMEHFARELDIANLTDAARNANTDDFLPPPRVIRLPRKHFESGRKLQERILPELRCSELILAGKKGAAAGQNNTPDQPLQLLRLFDSIRSELPAVDRSECETLSWVQKYAPTCAAEVLQPGREAFFLKEWLQALMIQSVDTGPGDSEKSKADPSKSKASGPAKKKRRRKKLDDFIVSSDEEADMMDEVSETEGDWTASGTHGILKKTVIRAGGLKAKGSKHPSRLANTVVISGPHGCGKTAAVYAVAKELGFEVFEINSSSRRSGKDVLDRIGDMTRNHLVSHQHRSNIEASVEAGEDMRVMALKDELAEDIESGKQPTMSSFFRPKAAVTGKKAAGQGVASPLQKDRKKDPPKAQKQSLILLDEADVIYEEDKQFWASVTGLMAQSKRPFIVTCNDETLLPLQALSLHGIFRLSRPPTDLAIDRLILIAANEGHALRRDAVEDLFEARNRDLRAATMDLNYWCQIGVGDRRGGFDWFYLRWPKGIDLDENGEVVRVVSEGTYQPGMNWLVRDHVVDNAARPDLVEEELLHQAWTSWNLDIGQWQSSAGLLPWARSLDAVQSGPGGRLAALEAFDRFADSMSASDICSSNAFGMSIEEPIDATLPTVPGKARDDYILGLQLLDAPPVVRYDSLPTALPSTMKSMARAALRGGGGRNIQHSTPALDPLTEGQLLDLMRSHFVSPCVSGTAISRIDFALAFDPIAASDSPQPPASLSYLDPSVFDRTMKLVTLDVAPYVRGIVAYDTHLQKQRLERSNLVSEGGRGGKRMRTTRAAYSALEGGSRSTTRGLRWFKADLNPHLVFRTAGDGWDKLVAEDMGPQLEDFAETNAVHGARQVRRKMVPDDSDDELS